VAAALEEEVAVEVVGDRGTLTWLGHACVLLTTTSGTRVILDPWLQGEGSPTCPVTLDDLGHVDVIAVTHGHFDHMGSVVPLALATGASVVCVPEMAAYFATLGLTNLIDMNKGGTVRVGDVALTMVSADHSCGIAVGDGPNAYGGNAVGFVVHLPEGEGGPVYVSGDTNVFGDLAVIRDLYHPETALMPIDGHYNMGPREAAHALTLLAPTRFIPYHYGTFPLLAGTPDQVRTELATTSSISAVVSLTPGQSVPLGL
jgi:L-ascorbate metabolism protein UlaG (beta-lactamase superfamily)